ncbi:MAG: glycosyltransferase family 4 protein [Thermotogae bacterium]|nr:glycosyltransferase family 4 protein [Thermotogota bacterium]
MILADALIADNRPLGIGVYTINVLRELLKIREDIVVLTHTPELFKAKHFLKAPTNVSPEFGKWAALRRLLYIQTLRGKSTLYRTYHSISLFWNGPQIITIHDLQPILIPDKYREQRWLYLFFLKPFIGRVQHIITVSERSKADILEFFKVGPDKVTVAYPSYDSQLYHPIPGVFPDTDRPYLLMVGARYRYKNAEVVLKALLKLPRYRLIVVGTSESYGKELLALANELGVTSQLEIHGYVPREELPFLYARAFALVFPSQYEGFGLPVLEAMAVGCPVIGTDAVAEAGGDAILYAVKDDPDSWVEAVGRLESEREKYVKKGFERIKRFSWKATAERINEVLQRFA